MRIVIQRVEHCSVAIDHQMVASIGKGMMMLVGIEHDDTEEDADWLAQKIKKMRIFGDSDSIMNLSIEDIGGQIMIISQFTLHASTKKGNRPSYIRAAGADRAVPLYEYFLKLFPGAQSGRFGADMKVTLCNDGPVTIIIDSKSRE